MILLMVPMKQYVYNTMFQMTHVCLPQVVVRLDTSDSIEEWSLAVVNSDEFITTTMGIYLEV